MSNISIALSLADSHCHIGIDCTDSDIDALADQFNNGLVDKDDFFHIMTTYHLDVGFVDRLLSQLKSSVVVAYFGVHPWYSHLFSTEDHGDVDLLQLKKLHYNKVLVPAPSEDLLLVLPVPILLEEHMTKLERLIEIHGHKFKCGIGEIGLDKLFRVPSNGYFGSQLAQNNGATKLSSCKVSMEHQTAVFDRQLQLANKLKKHISVHCVKAHGLLYDIIPRYTSISSVILHSYSGSSDQAKRWITTYKGKKSKLFFSFSNWINGTDNKRCLLEDIIGYAEDNQILVETDVSVDDYLVRGKHEDYFLHLEGIFEKVGTILGRDQDEMVELLRRNMCRSIE